MTPSPPPASREPPPGGGLILVFALLPDKPKFEIPAIYANGSARPGQGVWGSARRKEAPASEVVLFPPREQTISKNNISTQQKNNVT